MAKLKATPRSYAEAAEYLRGRDSVKLGNNTWLERLNRDQQIAVRLHSTYIVRFYQTGRVTLHTGGWYRVTTKDRMNRFIKGKVFQKDHQWYYDYPLTESNRHAGLLRVIFSEGMEVQQ